MKKDKTQYICQSCGYVSSKWLGRCPDCQEWNSFAEEKKVSATSKKRNTILPSVTKISDVVYENLGDRVTSDIGEFDRVLGGGIVHGELVLIGGDPGIGKSTLLLQTADKLSASNKVIYFSAEESVQQIKMRALRLNLKNMNFLVVAETNVLNIQQIILQEKPDVVVIDSIQTVYDPELTGSAGSVGQIRSSASIFMDIAKKYNIAVFLVGHITKDGAIAGPKVLEHMVDCVLYFEGEKNNLFRILRTMKNRFGSTNEIGVFEMRETGLVEIPNPSAYFIDDTEDNPVGTARSIIIEGKRALLFETQALTVFSPMAMPRRVAAGIDYNKLSLLIAVLDKIAGLNMRNQEVFAKLSGGLKVDDPGIDLAVTMAIVSSFKNKIITQNAVFLGEVGLNGDIRPVSYFEQRLNEATRLGIDKIVMPFSVKNKINVPNISYYKNINSVIADFF